MDFGNDGIDIHSELLNEDFDEVGWDPVTEDEDYANEDEEDFGYNNNNN